MTGVIGCGILEEYEQSYTSERCNVMSVLKPEVLLATADKLESGGYRQGVGMLRNMCEGTYCCIGVMSCVIAEKEDHFGVDLCDWQWDGHRWIVDVEWDSDGESNYSCLPRVIASQIWNFYGQQDVYIKLNDTEEWSFNEIAEYMRNEVEYNES